MLTAGNDLDSIEATLRDVGIVSKINWGVVLSDFTAVLPVKLHYRGISREIIVAGVIPH